MIHTNHTDVRSAVYIFPPVLRTVCFTRFIELAVKQVQFERVNTGSFFSWLWRWIRWCEVKIYENKTFQNSGHAKQNLQGIQNNECTNKSPSNSEESVSCVLVFSGWNWLAWLWFSLLAEVSAVPNSHSSFVFTGSAHYAYLFLGNGVIPDETP